MYHIVSNTVMSSRTIRKGYKKRCNVVKNWQFQKLEIILRQLSGDKKYNI